MGALSLNIYTGPTMQVKKQSSILPLGALHGIAIY